MAFGILEVSNGSRKVPGTCLLEEDAAGHAGRLKRVNGGHPEIVLVPQPSNNPNDPLNWPLWQRDLVLLLLSYCTNLCVGGYVQPIGGELPVP